MNNKYKPVLNRIPFSALATRRIAAGALAALLLVGGVAPTMNAFAAENNNIVASHIVDMNRTASISIQKFDETAMEADGFDLGSFHSTGLPDANVQSKLQDYAIQGVGYGLLKLGDWYQHTTGTEVEDLVGIENMEFLKALNLSTSEAKLRQGNKYFYNATQLDTARSNALKNDPTGTRTKLERIYNSGNTIAFPETDASGKTELNDLELGLYLMVEQIVPENVCNTTEPTLLMVPTTTLDGLTFSYSLQLYPKNQSVNPSNDKQVVDSDVFDKVGYSSYADTAQVSEGDTVNFRWVTDLPTITSEATYLTDLHYVDELSAGLTYSKAPTVFIYKTEADALANTNAVAQWDSGSGYFTESYYSEKDDTSIIDPDLSSTFTLTFTEKGLSELNKKYSDYFMVTYYTCTVNSDAQTTTVLGDEGNPNKVTMTWQRTNTQYHDSVEDEAIVYSFGLNLTKEFSDNAGNAKNVKFTLKNQTDGYYVVATGKDGIYDVTGEGSKEQATIFSPGESGVLNVYGLEADRYILEEIATDSGYALLKDAITIDIKGTESTIVASQAATLGKNNTYTAMSINSNPASATVDSNTANMSKQKQTDSENALVDLKVINNPTFELPHTGGAGTWMATILGALSAGGGAIVLAKTRRKKAE